MVFYLVILIGSKIGKIHARGSLPQRKSFGHSHCRRWSGFRLHKEETRFPSQVRNDSGYLICLMNIWFSFISKRFFVFWMIDWPMVASTYSKLRMTKKWTYGWQNSRHQPQQRWKARVLLGLKRCRPKRQKRSPKNEVSSHWRRNKLYQTIGK